MVAAFLIPATLVVTGFVHLTGLVTPEDLHGLIKHPIARIYLFVVIFLSLFHWAHRFRYALADLGLKGMTGLLSVICYGAAIVGTVFAAVMLI